MNCAACRHENRPGARFCEECAAPLKRACASCGAELRPTAKFCDECATPVGVAAPAARPTQTADSRKVVTIVFADLVGSTALHERLDAESARGFMESYYTAMRGAVESQGGTVTQLLGDGVKAVFGIPRVAEDDAIRAVRAAVAMQDAFRALAAQQHGAVGQTGLRVAVNTGEVVANDATEIIGDPVNVAARLQEQGGDGDVVVGESTHRLVAALVTLDLLGSFALKGRSEAVKAYRVVSLERPAGAATAPFVGRDEEVARLTAVFETATEKPAAGLAVLVGSPGLGKSRLIDEFARRRGDDSIVVRAHCDAAGGATFAPLAVALRQLFGIADGASVEALRAAIEGALPAEEADRTRIAAGIAALLGGSPASPEETFFVVRRLLGALAQTRPVVLVIDDLHWAEPLLLDLVEHLIQWGIGVPLFVLIGARPELRDLRSSLVTPGGLVSDVVTLAGLDAGAAMRLAANVIGASDLPAAIAAKVLATSEGNPLFVGELVRMLVQEGALTKEGDRWTVGANLAALEMPPTIHALLAARIERLRPEERGVLERAAVVGRHFSRSAVAALLPRETGDLDARLEALRRSELIERDTGWLLGEPVLRFHHVLIRDAAYRRLLKGTRAELHAKLADWIEAQVGDAPEHDETIGWHLEQAHQFLRELGPLDESGKRLGERAATRLAAAGRNALARDDLPVAADLLGRAIDRLDADDPARADLLLDWCEALLAAGDVGPAAVAIDDLGRFAAGSDRLRAWHTCFAGQLTVLTAPSALHATAGAVAAAADELTALGDAAGEAKAHFVHALALSRLGKIGACEAALDRALAAARRAGDRRRANTVLAIAPLAALWGPSPVTRASGRCLDVVRVLRITQGAPAVEAVALSCQGVLEALRGRTDAARRMIASARKMVEELGITQRLLEADAFGGLALLLEGDAPAAERGLRGAYEGLRDLGLGIDAARAAALLARALLAEGRVEEAETLSHESESLAGDDLKAAIAWRGVRAEALARRGEHVAAVEFARRAVELAAETDALLDHADARLALAAALRAAGRGREADAEERRATELWAAKGATLLAERTPLAAVSVALPAAAPAQRASHAPRRRPVRPNFAFEEMRRAEAAVAARDARALEALYRRDVEIVDHQFGITYGHAAIVERVRAIIEDSTESVFAHEPLATLGDSLALCRLRSTASGSSADGISIGATEVSYVLLIEADEQGSARRIEIYGDDRLGDAVARLYERCAELLPEGPERDLATVTARSLGTMLLAPGDPDRSAKIFTADFESVDHRHLSTWSLRGGAAFLEHLRALHQVAADVSIGVDDVLALEPGALLVRRMHAGTERVGGGAYERPFLLLLAAGADGRLVRAEFFDADREAAALARFEALTAESSAPRSVQRRVRPNAATAMLARFEVALAARDFEAIAAGFHESHQEIDHPTGSRYGRDACIASLQRLFRSRDPHYEVEPLATLGESLLLVRRRARAGGAASGRYDVGAYENEAIQLFEVDEGGLAKFAEVFAGDRLGDAIVRLYECHAERLPAGSAREHAATTARAVAYLLTPAAAPDLRALFAPTYQDIDHRSVGYGTLSTAEAQNLVGSLQEVAADVRYRVDDVLALTSDALVRRTTSSGVWRVGGGAFERTVCALTAFDPDGRVARHEIFGADREAEALARYDALVAGDEPKRSARRPIQANAATRAFGRFGATLAARDRDALAQHFDESLQVVHHPTRVTYSRREMLATWRSTLKAERFEFRQEILASLGDALALDHHVVLVEGLTEAHLSAVGPAEFDEVSLLEVDASGRGLRSEIFAADRLGDAVARLYERHAERLPEGAARARAEATARSVAVVVPGGFDRDRYAAAFRPDVEIVDHKLLGLGDGVGLETLFRSMAAWGEVAGQVASRPQAVLALTQDALLLRWLASGVGLESGGAFELAFLRLFRFDADGRVARYELFDIGGEAAALARFDELAGGGDAAPREHPFANAASRANRRRTECFNARDWAGVEACASPDLVFDERRRLLHNKADRQVWLEQTRLLFDLPESCFTIELVATRGERLSLHRHEFEGQVAGGGGPLALDPHWALHEVDRHGRIAAIVLFDLEDRDAAYDELDARFETGEGSTFPHVVRALGSSRLLRAREWQAWAAAHAPSFVYHDHRPLGFGETVGDVDALLRLTQATVDLAPDARYRYDHVRISARGILRQMTLLGTRDGGVFETPMFLVGEVDEQGRYARNDSYAIDDLDRALARFAELKTPARAESPFANTASRSVERMGRMLVEQPGSRWHEPLLATRGERLSLHRTSVEAEVAAGGGPLAFDDHLSLTEVDAEGRGIAAVTFDLDDEDAAYAELDARFEADPGAAHGRAVVEFVRAIARRDWDAVAALCSPAFVEHDHRSLAVLGTTHGAEAWMENFRTLVELAPDTLYRSAHVRTAAGGFLSVGTWQGSREGGRYEIPLIAVLAVDASGAIARADLYDPDQLAEARARFEEVDAGAPPPSRFANAATRTVERAAAMFKARDWRGFAGLFDAECRIDDRTALAQIETGRDEWLAAFRQMIELTSARPEPQVLATRGDRLVMFRMRWQGTPGDVGPSEVEWLLLVEVDARGNHVLVVSFEPAALGAAYTDLDARFAAGEGAAHPLASSWLADYLRCFAARDWDAMRSLFAPDLVGHNHRLVGWGTLHGPAALVSTLEAQVELAPDTRERVDHVRTCERGVLFEYAWCGTHEGGAFENVWLVLVELDGEGRARRADVWEAEEQATARARFEGLQTATGSRSRFANAATATSEPVIAALVAHDWAAFEALFAESFRCFDRRRVVQLEFDRAGYVAFTREVADGRSIRGESIALATRGERLALVRSTFVFADADVGPSEITFLLVTEVDERGRIVAYLRFDEDDQRSARDELEARFGAGEGAADPSALADHVATTVAIRSRDWDAMAAQCAPTFRMRDHRLLGWGTLVDDAATFVRVIRSAVELAADASYRTDHLRICARGTLSGMALCGTRDGGAFENRFLRVTEVDEQGRIRSYDLYDESDFDRALARFAEFAAPAELQGRFANAATRSAEVTVATWMAADWERFASLFPADARLSDRRRAVQLELGREELIAFSRELGEHATTRIIHVETLATRGERLALQRWRIELDGDGVGPSEICHLTLIDRAEQGPRKAGVVRWDDDAIQAAYAELDARFEAGEGAVHPHALAAHVATNAAIRSRDWGALAALCAPTFRMHDHRLLGWGTMVNDAATFVRMIRSAAELAPDSIYRDDHLRICARGTLSGMALCGTREGGAFENPFLRVTEVDEQGRILSHDIYDASDFERAFARFAELAAPAASEGRFENAASRAWRAVNEAWRVRDVSRFEALHPRALRYRDHRRLFQLDLDCEGFLDFARPLLTMRSASISIQLLATRGERLALKRFTMTMEDETVGPSAIDSLMLIETDERGEIAAYDRWDLDDEDAAWAEIEARWKAGEGARSPELRALWEVGAALERRDWDALAACYAPDCVGHDHRLVSWGTVRGPSAMVRTVQEMVALAPDAQMRTNHWRAHGRRALRDVTWLGTREGGAFESQFVTVTEYAADGRIVRADFYDPHHVDRALARFEELRVGAPRDFLAAGVKPNLATVSIEGSWIAFDAIDLAAAHEALEAGRVHFAPEFVWEDRRPVVGLSGDLELMMASARERLASGARHERRTIIGTVGDRIAIARVLWAGGPAEGRFEVEFLVVHEVNEAGLCTALLFFDPDDSRAAQREAWSRWAAIDPEVAPWVELLNDFTDAWNTRDRTTLRTRFADALVVEDHRHTGFGRIEGADAYVDSSAVLWELAPDQRIEYGWSWHVADRQGIVITMRREGTLIDGGAFESDYVWLSLARDGRVTHLELFEIDALDTALARFDELRPDPLRIPENAATRALERAAPLLANADLDALRAIAADDFCFEDRTRRAMLRGGVEEWMRGYQFLRTEMRARIHRRLVATAGDRLALTHLAWRETPGESSFLIERFHLVEIDAAGKQRAVLLFDGDDRAAAHAELFERYVAVGADGMPTCFVEYGRALEARDLARVRAALADDFVYHDRRRTGSGRLDGPDAYLASPRAWWELSEDGRMDVLYTVAITPHGRVTVNRMAGTNLEGGDFESFMVTLVWTRGDRIAGIEMFEVEQLDAALARLEALRPDPLRIPPTAATRMRDRHRDAFVARDWDAMRALASADFVYDDRGKRALVRGDVEAWVASMQFTTQPGFRSESALIGTLGDRIVLDRIRWFGKPDGDAFEFERVRLLEVGADGLLRAVLFFDPEDRLAASVEGLARFAVGEAAGSAGIAPLVPLYRALGGRSWEAARDCFAPDLIFVDRRTLGLGTLDREEWIASLQAGDELGDGVIVEVFRVLAWSEQGHVVAVRRFGTIAGGGGPFEVDAILTRLVVDGRIQRSEIFGEADAERAVARFAELCAERA